MDAICDMNCSDDFNRGVFAVLGKLPVSRGTAALILRVLLIMQEEHISKNKACVKVS
jgi:hypothetical protein